jgi:hypothetical protein
VVEDLKDVEAHCDVVEDLKEVEAHCHKIYYKRHI